MTVPQRGPDEAVLTRRALRESRRAERSGPGVDGRADGPGAAPEMRPGTRPGTQPGVRPQVRPTAQAGAASGPAAVRPWPTSRREARLAAAARGQRQAGPPAAATAGPPAGSAPGDARPVTRRPVAGPPSADPPVTEPPAPGPLAVGRGGAERRDPVVPTDPFPPGARRRPPRAATDGPRPAPAVLRPAATDPPAAGPVAPGEPPERLREPVAQVAARPAARAAAPLGRLTRRGRRTGPRVTVRPFRPGDEAGLAQVCLRTAADGADATAQHAHPGLPAAVYALPYVRFEPDLCLVVDDGTPDGRVSGYVLGTSDTVSFEDWCERAWWPAQRTAYPLADMVEPADRAVAALVHRPRRTPRHVTDRYPAHLHVDLLPHVQGAGWGRRLLEGFLAAAAAADAPAVHLGVSETNTRAIGFYARLGFALVERTEDALVLGRPV